MEESAQMLSALKNRLKKSNTSLFVFNIESDSTAFALAKQYKMPLIQLKLFLTKDAGDFFDNDLHPNRRANRKVAARLLERLEKYGLIPERYKTISEESNPHRVN